MALNVGDLVPSASLGELVDDVIVTVPSRELFLDGRTVVIGVPGAFTPVCTRRHVPEFVAQAASLRRAGVQKILCVAPNDPYVTAAWARICDPGGALRFLSDGNLAFARQLGVTDQMRELYCGERSKRYLLVANNGLIQKLRVERSENDYACTRVEDVHYIDS